MQLNWIPGLTLDAVEKQAILQAFRFYRGNKTQTANALGISIRTLDNKLEQYQNDGNKEQDHERELRRERAFQLARARGEIPPDATREVKENSDNASEGVHVESAVNLSTKSEMPLPKQPQVQTVLPKQTSPSGKPRGR